ncbi:MAG: DUF3850 domain-containing protein [Dehalococcoidia bacterium]|nr:MAG: DUF3850 domain-containing protein [Dehalococcoidia bacterium]
MSKTHHLKTDHDMFRAVIAGKKTCEIRFDDRGFKVGDTLILKETLYTGEEMKGSESMPLIYTGYEHMTKIKHILRGPVYGLMEGWVILSI